MSQQVVLLFFEQRSKQIFVTSSEINVQKGHEKVL